MADLSLTAVLDADPGITPLRGRNAEMGVIDRLVAAAENGTGGVLLVDGPAGIGKSRLSTEVVRRADRRGLRVLRTVAVRGRFTPFAPLLAAALGADSPLAGEQASRALGEDRDAAGRVLHALRSALLTAAAAGPLVITIDDLHRADEDTATAIRTLMDDLRPAGVLWVLAARRAQAEPAIGDLLAHLEAHGAELLRLGSLPLSASIAIVADFVRAEVTESLLDTTCGIGAVAHPYWLIETLRGLREEGRLSVAHGGATVVGSGPPRRVVEALNRLLQALSPRARQVVRIAAILPPSFNAAHLAAMIGCRPNDLIEPMDEAVRADLLAVDGAEIRFGQHLLREATRETLPSSLLRVLERESADVLMRAGAAPAEVASTLARTAEPGDRSAITTLRAAAEEIATVDPGTAADLTIRARELLATDDEARGLLLVSALTHLHRAMRTDEARELAARELRESLPAHQEAAVRLTSATAIGRPVAERTGENRAALALPGAGPHARAEHRAWLAYNLMESGEVGEGERHARAALAEAVEIQDGEITATARLVLAAAHCARGNGTAASAQLDLLRAYGPARPGPHAPLRDLLTANVLHCLGRTAEGTTALTDFLRRTRRDHHAPMLGLGTQFAAMTSMMTGQLAAARIELESAGPITADDAPVTLATVLHMCTSAALAQHLGDAMLGRRAVTTARRLRTSDSVIGRRSAYRVLAAAAAARGDVTYAARLLADDPLLPSGPPLPVEIGALTLAIWVAVAAGDRSLADRVVAAATSMEAGSDGAPAFAAGAAYIRGVIGGDPEALTAAADLLTSAGRPLLAALAVEDAGSALLRRGRDADAVVHLTTALDRFAALGATVDVKRVRRSLRSRTGAPRLVNDRSADGWSAITESELKVVRLIAAGATNRIAAQQLLISPHTVNTHVRSVFAKLGITSRVQLANVLRENGG